LYASSTLTLIDLLFGKRPNRAQCAVHRTDSPSGPGIRSPVLSPPGIDRAPPGHGAEGNHGRFHGKVALVTGAASGIGRATAIRLANEGAAVACVDRAVDGAEATAAGIRDAGGKAIAIGCDVLDLDQIKATVAAVDELGRIDVLRNIAGIGHFAKDEEETPSGGTASSAST
jgi:hypothetical protein